MALYEAEEKMVDVQVKQKLEFNSPANYKDALLASLYSHVDFLKHELEEKKLLIRTLKSRKFINIMIEI